ncbi:Uncharacterised protein [Candidatus Tiddalikarchaeum anstoanum]|nr:Uncharacterised protein [Candidatus Tiddalikarchaeum anstoanum]
MRFNIFNFSFNGFSYFSKWTLYPQTAYYYNWGIGKKNEVGVEGSYDK